MNGTPARERLPFPQSIHPSPHRTMAISSASSSSATPSGPLPTNSPITVDALLKAHATSDDPKLAALEQSINDRNVLSAQNAQLWKLIEKQRAGYTQILKELERVRGERDSYRIKAGGGTPNHDKLRSKTSETPLRKPAEDPRQAMKRHHSDDRPTPTPQTPSTPHPPLHSSRSFDPMASASSSMHSTSTSSLSPRSETPPPPPPPFSAPNLTFDSTPLRTQKHSPAALPVPPHSDTLPVPASTPSPSHETTQFFHVASSSISSAQYTIPSRKSSIADSISGMSITSATSTTPSTSNPIHGTPTQASSSHPQGAITPQTAPPGFGFNDQIYPPTRLAHPQQATITQANFSTPQILTPTATPSEPTHLQPTSQNTELLSTSMEAYTPHNLSRESRISLPDEARQYIANMGESPVPSPKVDAFAPRSQGPPTALQEPPRVMQPNDRLVPPPRHSSRDNDSSSGNSEFLDMDEDLVDEEDLDEADEQSPLPRTPSPSPPQLVSTPQSHAHGRKVKTRAAVEDFPLPPPNPHLPLMSQIQTPTQAQSFSIMTKASSGGQPQSADTASLNSSRAETLVDDPIPPTSPPPPEAAIRTAEDRSFRALPLLSSDLPHTTISVSHSFVRPNDRGKEVLSFIVFVNPGNGKDGWKVEKMYSDVLALDQRVRNSVGKSVGKRIANLPEGKLWKDHAPAKVDQRKTVLEHYLQTLINLPVKRNDEVIAFFTSDIVREAKQPVMQAGYKEGYLTKRGKNFGGWKTRYFVLQGPVLEYYDCRGGAHLGSINVTGASIGRQQKSERTAPTDEEKEYRHAFLIVEAKKGPGGNHHRHVLCAESDHDRDSWVEMLVRYFTGTYCEDPYPYSAGHQNGTTLSQPRSSTSSNDPSSRRPGRGPSRDDISILKGAAVPISQLAPDSNNAKLFPATTIMDDMAAPASSPAKSTEPSPIDRQGTAANFEHQSARRVIERSLGQPSSLPDSSPLSNGSAFLPEGSVGGSAVGQRANSELGHYTDTQEHRAAHAVRHQRQLSPERHRAREPHNDRKSFHPTLGTVAPSPIIASPSDRVPSPEKLDPNGKVKISRPLGGAPIPSGFKFGGKDSASDAASTASDRREKAKSRSFWGFGKANGMDKLTVQTPRVVFAVPLEEALDVAQIANLPAIVFRAIQYLEAKQADQEEGIYRLSGSSAVIKSLKDRFNLEGDVDLLASDEYWDPHAIAGLLKSFLRELPASILTRELHLRFLSVIDLVDAQERIKELSRLIAALPIANYSLLRALTAHLILIVQNSNINKMTMRNVGIVFSPTLGIPAGVFSLMLGEFNRVFNVDADADDGETSSEGEKARTEPDRRNSRQYSDAAADQLLGLSGRSLKIPAEEVPSDGDDFSIQDESGTETTDDRATIETGESSTAVGTVEGEQQIHITPPDTPMASKPSSKASHAAAARGLNVTVTASDRGNRHSRMMGLPTSPRPPHSPTSAEAS